MGGQLLSSVSYARSALFSPKADCLLAAKIASRVLHRFIHIDKILHMQTACLNEELMRSKSSACSMMGKADVNCSGESFDRT